MTNVTTPSNTEAAKAEPVFDDPIGITDPPIDELLDKVSSSTLWSSLPLSAHARSIATTKSRMKVSSSS